jgi:FixJ family two-component response regulator
VVMTEMGGRALADGLRLLFPSVPIVFMSGHPDDMVLRHGIEEARKYFLPMPFTPTAFLEKVRLALDRATQGSPPPSA